VTRPLPILVAVVAFAGAGACRRSTAPTTPARPALGAVSVRDVTPESVAPARLDVAKLEADVRARLAATGLFSGAAATDGGAGAVTRVRMQVGIESVEVEDKGLARARVGLRLDTRPSDAPGAIEEQFEGQGEQPFSVPRHGRPEAPRPDRSALYEQLVLKVAHDLVDGFAARRKLREGPPEAVHAALLSDAGELREEAIHTAGQRQLRQEVPVLLKMLSDPDEATRDAALGALIAMRERRAVTELTRTRSLRDRREMRKIIEAIAILGGDEAQDYLSFVAQTHDDDEIRAEAAAAKARLDRRAADASNSL
jgi:hypothetical protein